MVRENHPLGEPFEKYPYVQLTADELEKATEVASEIFHANHYSNEGDFNKSVVANNIGASGELAFAKYYGLDFNDTILHGGDSYDYEIYHRPSEKKGTVDVKTISFGGGDLLVQTSRDIKADLYVLVEERGNAFGLIGYAEAGRVASADLEPAGTYSPVEVRRIPRERLTSLPEPETITKPP